MMKAEHLQALEKLPQSVTCRRIAFDHAQVVPGFVKDTYFLIVSGKKPWVSMRVELVPLIYVDRPDYWGIEVVGCQSGMGLPVEVPYTVHLEVTQVLGKSGIEVLGAGGAEKIKVP